MEDEWDEVAVFFEYADGFGGLRDFVDSFDSQDFKGWELTLEEVFEDLVQGVEVHLDVLN